MLPGEGVVQAPAKVLARQQVALEKVMETRACRLLREVNRGSNVNLNGISCRLGLVCTPLCIYSSSTYRIISGLAY
jgi:hypothetical protein